MRSVLRSVRVLWCGLVAAVVIALQAKTVRRVVLAVLLATCAAIALVEATTRETPPPKPQIVISCPCGTKCVLGWCWCKDCE